MQRQQSVQQHSRFSRFRVQAAESGWQQQRGGARAARGSTHPGPERRCERIAAPEGLHAAPHLAVKQTLGHGSGTLPQMLPLC
jgi:hypothetical protein